MQRLYVSHTTTYRYHRPVAIGEHRLMLRPRDSHDLRLLKATLEISPSAQLRWMHDVNGNSVAIATFGQLADTLRIKSYIVINRYPLAELDVFLEPYAEKIPFSYPARDVPDLGRTIERHYPDPNRTVIEWTRHILEAPHVAGNTQSFLREMTAAIKRDFRYTVRHEPGVQTPVQTLSLMSGSCRDFALLMMEAVRNIGIAARFVSGYLYDPAIDGAASDVTGAGSTHAWLQVYLPGAGWIEFDPTNGSAGGRNLVPIAVAREPELASPVSGTFEGTGSDFAGMEVDVSVRSRQFAEDITEL